MRGSIDLTTHKLAGLYKPPAKRTRTTAMVKCPDNTYRQVWRLADGAVRDCFANHPDYLTTKGKMHARLSLVKRVTGTFYGYATQVAKGGSETPANVAGVDAATSTDTHSGGAVADAQFVTGLRWACESLARLWRRGQSRRPNF